MPWRSTRGRPSVDHPVGAGSAAAASVCSAAELPLAEASAGLAASAVPGSAFGSCSM